MKAYNLIFISLMATGVIIFAHLITLDINTLMIGVASGSDMMISIVRIIMNLMGISVTIFYSYQMFIKEKRSDIEAVKFARYRDKLHGFIKSNKYQGRT